MADDTAFDVVVLGTGLTESITAAALAKAGFKVAQIDVNEYYGGDQASLAADEFATWADARSVSTSTTGLKAYSSVSRSGDVPPFARHYSLSLAPALLPSTGPFLSALISSGVSRYGAYRLLERVAVFDGGALRAVPASKEDVFKAAELSLLDKRRLMRFLTFAAGEFEGKQELVGKETMPFVDFLNSAYSIGDKLAHAIAYALAFCASADEPTLPYLTRLRSYLRSSGRYGPSPFLVGHYGGLGEIAQGFCRAAAVAGAVYILGRSSIDVRRIEDGKYAFKLNEIPDTLTADILLSAPDLLPANLSAPTLSNSSTPVDETEAVARAVLILDGPLSFPPTSGSASTTTDTEDADHAEAGGEDEVEEKTVDTAVIVFPPGALPGGSPDAAVHAFITGQGTMSAPAGKYVLYLSTPVSNDKNTDTEARTLLAPYVDALLATSPTPPTRLFELFYIQRTSPTLPPSSPVLTSALSKPTTTEPAPTKTLFTTPSLPLRGLANAPDAAATNAETLFFDIARSLRTLHPEHAVFAPADEAETERGETEEAEVNATVGVATSGAGKDQFAELELRFWPPVAVQEDDDDEF
ncbi:FAD/NAD(P)-binding domain-containing protein [Peniophora sp. CONT]|nr:FAD/NAD(P)-binding domain-containing protein [Peniophora sp. CONT]